MLVRNCGACGFGNELDDCWCGGCGRAVPVKAATAPDMPVRPPRPFSPSEPRSGESKGGPPPPPKARPPVVLGASAAAAMLAINRRRGEPAGTAKNDDVADQDQLDALFGAG